MTTLGTTPPSATPTPHSSTPQPPAGPPPVVVLIILGVTVSALIGLVLGLVERAVGASPSDALNCGFVGGGIILTAWLAALALLRRGGGA